MIIHHDTNGFLRVSRFRNPGNIVFDLWGKDKNHLLTNNSAAYYDTKVMCFMLLYLKGHA